MLTYRQVVRFSKGLCKDTVHVRRVKLGKDFDGDCQRRKEHFLIRINRELPDHEAIDTLIHEIAHVMSWDRCPVEEHGIEWGKAYSRVYRAFLKEFFNKAC